MCRSFSFQLFADQLFYSSLSVSLPVELFDDIQIRLKIELHIEAGNANLLRKKR